jgi:IS5 family transposase
MEQGEQLIELLGEVAEGGEQKTTAIREDMERFSSLLARVVSQTERRVFGADSVPSAEKLVSIFEPHTDIICRGKSGKPTEFGKKVWLSEVDGGIVSSYRILDGNPSDNEQIEPELEHHLRLFGAPPKLLAADRGCYSPEKERFAEELGVEMICLPKRGSKTEERRKHEKQRWFKRGQRFRAGSEGRISVLKRRGHLGTCRDYAKEGFERWVGWGILSGNLSTIARSLASS